MAEFHAEAERRAGDRGCERRSRVLTTPARPKPPARHWPLRNLPNLRGRLLKEREGLVVPEALLFSGVYAL